ncbi:MAG: hypothetical protein K0U20_09460 [Proteobacteria bacterium]|nr:hypothetical protein [Pseudomonadota bacterium]MCH9735753.1 hypothetical protein [Actinomycetes bacterium]
MSCNTEEKTYIDWRGTDLSLLDSYRNTTTLTTYYGGSTFVPAPQTTPVINTEYEIDVEDPSEEEREALYNIKGE